MRFSTRLALSPAAALVFAAVSAGAAAPAQPASGQAAAGPTAHAVLENTDGKEIGRAELREMPRGVLVHLTLTGAPTGTHAFHIHETGKCEPPFQSAGGHFNPTHAQHGYLDPKGAHAGDLPNLHVPSNGSLEIEVMARDVTLGQGQNSLLDADGSALVLHAGTDDYRSNPAGDAGSRVACGVITK